MAQTNNEAAQNTLQQYLDEWDSRRFSQPTKEESGDSLEAALAEWDEKESRDALRELTEETSEDAPDELQSDDAAEAEEAEPDSDEVALMELAADLRNELESQNLTPLEAQQMLAAQQAEIDSFMPELRAAVPGLDAISDRVLQAELEAEHAENFTLARAWDYRHEDPDAVIAAATPRLQEVADTLAEMTRRNDAGLSAAVRLARTAPDSDGAHAAPNFSKMNATEFEEYKSQVFEAAKRGQLR